SSGTPRIWKPAAGRRWGCAFPAGGPAVRTGQPLAALRAVSGAATWTAASEESRPPRALTAVIEAERSRVVDADQRAPPPSRRQMRAERAGPSPASARPAQEGEGRWTTRPREHACG